MKKSDKSKGCKTLQRGDFRGRNQNFISGCVILEMTLGHSNQEVDQARCSKSSGRELGRRINLEIMKQGKVMRQGEVP